MGEYRRSWKVNSRPPRPGSSSFPSWEETFCTSVCYVPWERICAAKGWMSGYKTIVDWDDSGALEAFENAKARYWAKINHLPCDVPLPDPDIYIDEVSHNAVIDPELVADLYRKPLPPPWSANNEDLSFEAFLNANTPVKATGWGDAEERDRSENHPKQNALIEKPLPAPGWGDAADHQSTNWNSSNLWNENGNWGDGIVGNGSWRGTNNSWDNQKRHASMGRHWNNWNHEQGRRNGRKRNGYVSRFSKSRNQINDSQSNTCMADSNYKNTMHAGKPIVMDSGC